MRSRSSPNPPGGCSLADPRRARRLGAQGPGDDETAPGRRETAPLREARRRQKGGGGRPSVVDGGIQLEPGPASRAGGSISASAWRGSGFAAVGVRRAEARQDPEGSAFPVTRSGSRAGPCVHP
jgi:hypothetical protein